MAIEAVLIGPSWPGLLLNRQFLLARLPACVSPGFTTPGGSLRFAHRGLISFTPPACKPAARKGCEDISPGLSEAIPGVTATLYTNEAMDRLRVANKFPTQDTKLELQILRDPSPVLAEGIEEHLDPPLPFL